MIFIAYGSFDLGWTMLGIFRRNLMRQKSYEPLQMLWSTRLFLVS